MQRENIKEASSIPCNLHTSSRRASLSLSPLVRFLLTSRSILGETERPTAYEKRKRETSLPLPLTLRLFSQHQPRFSSRSPTPQELRSPRGPTDHS